MVRTVVATSLLWLLFAHSASSKPNCAGPQSEMTECAYDLAEASRKAMEAAYDELARRVGPDTRTRLDAAQKAWIRYLEASCELMAYADGGGSVAPMYRQNCLAEMRDERTRYLRESMDCSDKAPHCIEDFSDREMR